MAIARGQLEFHFDKTYQCGNEEANAGPHRDRRRRLPRRAEGRFTYRVNDAAQRIRTARPTGSGASATARARNASVGSTRWPGSSKPLLRIRRFQMTLPQHRCLVGHPILAEACGSLRRRLIERADARAQLAAASAPSSLRDESGRGRAVRFHAFTTIRRRRTATRAATAPTTSCIPFSTADSVTRKTRSPSGRRNPAPQRHDGRPARSSSTTRTVGRSATPS